VPARSLVGRQRRFAFRLDPGTGRGRVHRRRQIFRCACRKWQQDHKEKEKPSHAHRKEMGHARRPGNGAGHHIA
jgi:hypothetical protein